MEMNFTEWLLGPRLFNLQQKVRRQKWEIQTWEIQKWDI